MNGRSSTTVRNTENFIGITVGTDAKETVLVTIFPRKTNMPAFTVRLSIDADKILIKFQARLSYPDSNLTT
ncbi:hypothetical protein ADUPG1_001273, partial [Aduncisulcus paluster]